MKCLAVCAQVALLAGGVSAVSSAQAPAAQMSSAQMIAAEQAAIAKLGLLDGVWRGTGSMIDRPGETPRDMLDTLRVGSFLDGTVKVWGVDRSVVVATLRPDRRYERMDITGLTGVTEAQRQTLLGLGAVDL